MLNEAMSYMSNIPAVLKESVINWSGIKTNVGECTLSSSGGIDPPIRPTIGLYSNSCFGPKLYSVLSIGSTVHVIISI